MNVMRFELLNFLVRVGRDNYYLLTPNTYKYVGFGSVALYFDSHVRVAVEDHVWCQHYFTVHRKNYEFHFAERSSNCKVAHQFDHKFPNFYTSLARAATTYSKELAANCFLRNTSLTSIGIDRKTHSKPW